MMRRMDIIVSFSSALILLTGEVILHWCPDLRKNYAPSCEPSLSHPLSEEGLSEEG